MVSSSSGEFHAFRLPVPDLWLDIFQKMKAAGLNGVRSAGTQRYDVYVTDQVFDIQHIHTLYDLTLI